MVTDASGNVVGEQRYTPFGETRVSTGSLFTDHLYTGQRQMADIGLYHHYGARFYSPKLGRFISPDSIVPGAGNPQAFNRYSYVLNNPILFNDPTGHRATCDDGECPKSPLPPKTPTGGGGGSGGVVVDTGNGKRRNGGEPNDAPTTFGEDAAYWANLHKNDPQPPGIDDDCTDFISKALLNAGMKTNATWDPNIKWNSKTNSAETAWYTSYTFYSYLTGSLGFGTKVINNAKGSLIQNNQDLQNFMKAGRLERGDLVFYTADGYSESSHVAIIIGFDKDHVPLIVDHNTPHPVPRTLDYTNNPSITVVSFVFLPPQAP